MGTVEMLLLIATRLASLGVAAESILATVERMRAEGRTTMNPDEVQAHLAQLDQVDAAWQEQLARLRAAVTVAGTPTSAAPPPIGAPIGTAVPPGASPG